MNDLLFPILSLGGLGLIFGIVLGYASKKFAVKVDERVPLVRECLPSANCGGCGYPGCDAYAQAVVDGVAPVDACTVGGAAVSGKISKIMSGDTSAEQMDTKVSAPEPKKAFVKCNGTCKNAKQKGEYYGTLDCREAVIIPGAGAKACEYGCLGLGSCVKACNFGAMSIVDGIVKVYEERCIGCGACVKACPKGVIELMPPSEVIRVACNSKNKLKEVKDTCSVGCMTCGICVKNCPEEAITFENSLPKVDKEKCVKCLICVQKCPTKALIVHGEHINLKKAE